MRRSRKPEFISRQTIRRRGIWCHSWIFSVVGSGSRAALDRDRKGGGIVAKAAEWVEATVGARIARKHVWPLRAALQRAVVDISISTQIALRFSDVRTVDTHH